MSGKLAVVLTWAERIAAVIKIAVPAIRGVASELEAAKAGVAPISNDED